MQVYTLCCSGQLDSSYKEAEEVVQKLGKLKANIDEEWFKLAVQKSITRLATKKRGTSNCIYTKLKLH